MEVGESLDLVPLCKCSLCVSVLNGGGGGEGSYLDRFWNLRLSELERAVLLLLLRLVSGGLAASLNMSGRLSRLGKLAARGRLFTLDPFRSSLHLCTRNNWLHRLNMELDPEGRGLRQVNFFI
jgi:hypothetical protein